MEVAETKNEQELTSNTGNSVLSTTSKTEKTESRDSTPTSSTDAYTNNDGAVAVSDDPISSTSNEFKDNIIQKPAASSSSSLPDQSKMSIIDSDADLMGMENMPSEKITEDVEDLVHDLESLLGESTDSFNLDNIRKKDVASAKENTAEVSDSGLNSEPLLQREEKAVENDQCVKEDVTFPEPNSSESPSAEKSSSTEQSKASSSNINAEPDSQRPDSPKQDKQDKPENMEIPENDSCEDAQLMNDMGVPADVKPTEGVNKDVISPTSVTTVEEGEQIKNISSVAPVTSNIKELVNDVQQNQILENSKSSVVDNKVTTLLEESADQADEDEDIETTTSSTVKCVEVHLCLEKKHKLKLHKGPLHLPEPPIRLADPLSNSTQKNQKKSIADADEGINAEFGETQPNISNSENTKAELNQVGELNVDVAVNIPEVKSTKTIEDSEQVTSIEEPVTEETTLNEYQRCEKLMETANLPESGAGDKVEGGTVNSVESMSVETSVVTVEAGTVDTVENMAVDTSVEAVEAGTVDIVESMTVDTSVDKVEGGTVDAVDTSVDTVEAGTVDTVESITVDTVQGGAVDTVESMTVDTMESGTIDTVESMTVDTAESDAVDTVQSMTVDTAESGTVDTVESGTVDAVESVDNIERGSVDAVKNVDQIESKTVETMIVDTSVDTVEGGTVDTVESVDNSDQGVDKIENKTVDTLESGNVETPETVDTADSKTVDTIEECEPSEVQDESFTLETEKPKTTTEAQTTTEEQVLTEETTEPVSTEETESRLDEETETQTTVEEVAIEECVPEKDAIEMETIDSTETEAIAVSTEKTVSTTEMETTVDTTETGVDIPEDTEESATVSDVKIDDKSDDKTTPDSSEIVQCDTDSQINAEQAKNKKVRSLFDTPNSSEASSPIVVESNDSVGSGSVEEGKVEEMEPVVEERDVEETIAGIEEKNDVLDKGDVDIEEKDAMVEAKDVNVDEEKDLDNAIVEEKETIVEENDLNVDKDAIVEMAEVKDTDVEDKDLNAEDSDANVEKRDVNLDENIDNIADIEEKSDEVAEVGAVEQKNDDVVETVDDVQIIPDEVDNSNRIEEKRSDNEIEVKYPVKIQERSAVFQEAKLMPSSTTSQLETMRAVESLVNMCDSRTFVESSDVEPILVQSAIVEPFVPEPALENAALPDTSGVEEEPELICDETQILTEAANAAKLNQEMDKLERLQQPALEKPLTINVDEVKESKVYSPKLIIKPIKAPDDEITTTSAAESENREPLKMTITKQSDKMHSILKIYNPNDPVESQPPQEEAPIDQIVPKLIIKKDQQASPKISTRSSKSYNSPTSSTTHVVRSSSPRVTAKQETVSPLKITIKTPIKNEEIKQKHSPKLIIKPLIKPDDEPKEDKSPKLTIKPIKPPEELEQVHSPKIRIKPIPKPEETPEPQHTLRVKIKPVKSPEPEVIKSSPKVTIKPVVKPPELEEENDEEEVKEPIVLKINKGNLATPTKDGRKRDHSEDKNEKLKKIKLKFSKEGGHPHIVHQQSEEVEKRSIEEEAQDNPKKLKIDNNPVENDVAAVAPSRVERQETNESESLQQPPQLLTQPPFQVLDTPPSILITQLTPTPRKRGRPRKVPLADRIQQTLATSVEATPTSEDSTASTSTDSGRPKRSCRGQSARVALGIKPRKPRGSSRGRGSARGMGTKTIPMKPEKEIKLSKARLKLLEKSAKEQLAQKTDDSIGPLSEFSNFRVPSSSAELEATSSNEVSSSQGTEEIPSSSISDTSVSTSVSTSTLEPKLNVSSTEIAMFEEETRMSADSRAQTPAKQVVVATPMEVEESQSSIQSTATIESGKTPVSKPAKGSRLEVHQDLDQNIISADQLAEYHWNGNGPFMLQEQVAQFLGIKSFKRKYPNVQRRAVDMQERDFIRDNALASEAMCDMGLTAVNCADILDIMYSDFQDKYEEYCKHQRDRQTKELINKHKAMSLAATQEKNKQDMTDQAMQSAASWNANFNKTRREQRKASMDLQTWTVHYPKNKMKQLTKGKIGHYPVALVPGQFTDFYQEYTPTEINNLPINTMCYDPINIPESDESDSSSSDSDSESSSGSSSSGSCSGDEDCKLCVKQQLVIKKVSATK